MSVDTESLRKAIGVGTDRFGLSEMVFTHYEVEMMCDEIDSLRNRPAPQIRASSAWFPNGVDLTGLGAGPTVVFTGTVMFRAVPYWWQLRRWRDLLKGLYEIMRLEVKARQRDTISRDLLGEP